MERRRFLASVSAAVPVALAGCMGGGDDEETTTETTQTTTSTTTQTTTETTTQTTTTDSGPMSVGEGVAVSAEQILALVDAGASAFVLTRGQVGDQIHANEGERYITLKFAPTGIQDYRSFVEENVTVTINDEETFDDPIFPLGGGPSRFDAAYSIPTDLTPYTTTVTVDLGDDSASWEFVADDIAAITQSVDYSVGELSVPDSVPAGEDFTAELPIDNQGDDVRFYALLEGTANAPTRISEDLTGGEETTVEVDATAPEAEDASEFDVSLDWSADSAAATIQYE